MPTFCDIVRTGEEEKGVETAPNPLLGIKMRADIACLEVAAPGRGREDRLLWKRPFSAKWSGGNEAKQSQRN